MKINQLRGIYKNEGLVALKELLYNATSSYSQACILDSCELKSGVVDGEYEFIAAFGSKECLLKYDEEMLNVFEPDQWKMAVISYDLKNHFENLKSNNQDQLNQPEILLFVPEVVITVSKNGSLVLEQGEELVCTKNLEHQNYDFVNEQKVEDKKDYLKNIDTIHELIREGDVYELNYCREISRNFTSFNTLNFHKKLIMKSPVPMASYLKWDEHELSGASMERYLKREGNSLYSQPIKGTIKKGITNAEDIHLIEKLRTSVKDRAENVMIVDLVRNDFSRICMPGSIQVEELFGIYSYLQVHQMISTIKGQLKQGATFSKILKASFPMGSMTGAPKIAAMNHIENLENFKRGWYSGALGYIKPNGDFDFCVNIRSLFSNQLRKKLSYCAGGAITIDSDPIGEWKEYQLKTSAIRSLLS